MASYDGGPCASRGLVKQGVLAAKKDSKYRARVAELAPLVNKYKWKNALIENGTVEQFDMLMNTLFEQREVEHALYVREKDEDKTHLHVMFSTGTTPMGKTESDQFYRDIRLALRMKGRVSATFQHVWQPFGFMKYLLKKDNNSAGDGSLQVRTWGKTPQKEKELLEMVIENEEAEEKLKEEGVNAGKTKLGEWKEKQKVREVHCEYLFELIDKYCLKNTNDIKKLNDADFKLLQAIPMWDKLLGYCIAHARTNEQRKEYLTMLDIACEVTKWDRFTHLNTSMGVTVLDEFFEFHLIDKQEFAENLIRWADMHYPKKNTMYFQGESNSGKSYLMQAFIGWARNVNRVTNNSNFWAMNLPDSTFIVMEETMVEQKTIEDMKLLFAGETFNADVKNRVPQEVKRAPVWVCTNANIWNSVPAAQEPLKNRLICDFSRLRKFDYLRNVDKAIHPRSVRAWLNKHLPNPPARPVDTSSNDSDQWESDAEVDEFIATYESEGEKCPQDCICQFCLPNAQKPADDTIELDDSGE